MSALGEVARRLGVAGRTALEPLHLPAAALAVLGAVVPIDLDPILAACRRGKDLADMAAIRRSVAALDAAFAAVAGALRPGVTERDVFFAAHRGIAERAAEPVRLDANVASGPARTTDPDPHATDRPLESGDLVIVDLYPSVDGYVADACRTFVVGEPDAVQIERHAVLVAALETAQGLLRPGTPVAEIDGAVRGILASAGGYDRTMAHHTGHGIGLFAWEEPWIGPGGDPEARLVDGDVICLEPGLYLPGWGGMRLEWIFRVSVDGPERLDRFPSTLTAE